MKTATDPRQIQSDPLYREILGEAAWQRLAPAVRLRFGLKPGRGEAFRYEGVMAEVRCSRAGWLLAQLLRMIGTPLAPYSGRHVPTIVEVLPERHGAGLLWRRVYRFAGRAPVAVSSIKRPDGDGGLLEAVGGGFGMELEVFERDGRLHFMSRRYFWQLGPLRLPLPAVLAPGLLHVVHGDEGGGRFRFTLSTVHPWLGETFYQDGVFRAVRGV
jgi:hypothetical protein